MKVNKKTVLTRLALALVALLVCEVAARVVLAFFVGPRVLAYGTSMYRDATSLPSKVMVKVGYTPPTPEKPIGVYRKFAPNELKFDRDEHGDRFSPTINGQGFRGSDFSLAKGSGVVRIVTLGGSSTFGYHSRDDQTYPHYLELVLNAERDDRAFEVINLGIPHIDSGQIVSLFFEEALPLDPDVVTVYAGWNDSGGLRQILTHRNERPAVYDFFRSRVILLAFADSLMFYRTQRFYPRDLEALRPGKVEGFLGNLERVREECSRRGIHFVVATQQAKSTLVAREDLDGLTYEEEVGLARETLDATGVPRRALVFLMHAELMRELEAWAEATSVPLVHAREALDQERSTLLTYVHLSPRGNQQVAEAFAEQIRDLLE